MDQQNVLACRGDLVVVKREMRSVCAGTYKSVVRPYYSLALVTGVTRDGRVKKYRVAGDHYESKAPPPAGALIVKQTKVSANRAFADLETRCRDKWDANDFDSLEAVREYLRPYLLPAP